MPMFRIWMAVLVFAVSTLGWAAEEAPASIDEAGFSQLLEAGTQLVMSGRPAEAIPDFDKIIAGYEAYYREKDTQYYCARWQQETLIYLLEAANKKVSAKVVSSNWAYAYYMKAYSLVELERIAEAKEMLNRAVALSPHNSQFLAELGNIYQREKNWPKALETFQAAESAARDFSPPDLKNSELSRAWRGIGYVYVEQNRLDEAEQVYLQCLELDASDSKAVNELRYIQDLRAKASGQ
jgi:tetratricopeptide (TPR) repeat protein